MKEQATMIPPLMAFNEPYRIPKQPKYRNLLMQLKGRRIKESFGARLADGRAIEKR